VRETVEHIRREEKFMESVGYPQLARHKEGHDSFVDELRSLQDQFAAGSITVAPRLSMLLRDWLSLHIRRYDKDIAVFLRKQKREAAHTPRPRA
jgi:hemerythrin-like metal-binding protein